MKHGPSLTRLLRCGFATVALGASALPPHSMAMSNDSPAGTVAAAPLAPADAAERARLEAQYGRIPLNFEANAGQTDAQVKYFARGTGYALYLTPQEAVLDLIRKDRKDSVLRIGLVGASSDPAVSGQDLSSSVSNYLVGRDPSQWQAGVPNYASVRYSAVYPGIDLVYHGNQDQLEYDFIVAPHADPKNIRMRFDGANRLGVNQAGELVIGTAGGAVVQHKPLVYQQDGQRRVTVAGSYVLLPHHQASFVVASYDRSRPLVIDPVLVYSTYLGGSGNYDGGNAITVDGSGSAYITGQTRSVNFPTQNPYQAHNNSPVSSDGVDTTRYNAFVSKLNPAGNALVYSTYLGGSSGPANFNCGSGGDLGKGIAVDGNGNAVVVGMTDSIDFPVLNAVQPSRELPDGTACTSGFVTKLNSSGSGLIFSSYLTGSGGSGFAGTSDFAGAVAIDSTGAAYVTGTTAENYYCPSSGPCGVAQDFPTTRGAFQTVKGGDFQAYVAKFGLTGALVYSTFLDRCAGTQTCGDSGFDQGNGIAVNSSGDAYVTGYLLLADSTFAPTASAAQSAPAQGFVAELNASGSTLLYATYLGGNNQNTPAAIALDPSGNFYVTGTTTSTNFPTVNPFQASVSSFSAFLTKYNSAGAIVYSTYFGSPADGNRFNGTNGVGVGADDAGNAYLIGNVSCGVPDVPLLYPLRGPVDCEGSILVAAFNPTGSGLLYSTYFGGTRNDTAGGIAVDGSGNAYITGNMSPGLQTVNAFQASQPAGNFQSDSPMIAKISPEHCGDLSFTSANYAVVDSSPSATITVSRTNATQCVDAASVNYCSYSGTANVSNYQNVSGTLDWASGDKSDKTFAVPISNSSSQSGDLTVNLLLTNTNNNCGGTVVTTPLGADLGARTSATLIIEPQTTVTPTSLAFGDVALGDSSPAKNLTLENHQATSISVGTSISGSGFAISGGTCGATLAAAKSCTIAVSFTPVASGAVTGTLTLSDSPDSRSPHSIALSGTGTTQTTVTPGSEAFGDVVVGSTSAARTVTLENHESAPISVSASINGAGFAISSTTCGSTLAAAKSCTVSLTFTPSADAVASGTLKLTDSPDSASPHSIALSGTGTTQTTVTPASEAFGDVTVGSTSPVRTVTLENHETVSISLNTSISGTGFAISGGTCGSALAADKSCTVTLTFTPAATGAVSGKLILTDSPDSASPHSIALSGTGK